MKQPQDDDEIEAAMRRMEREFGDRRDPHAEPPPPARPPSPYGEGPPPRPAPAASFAEGPPTPPSPQGLAVRPAGRPLASLIILGAIVVIYIISFLLSGSLFEPSLAALIFLGAKQNELIAAGELWRLVGAMFLHGNLVHIFFNAYALYALGPESERIYGTPRFLAVYFLAGVGGSVASYLFSPATSVGASGAIFGLMGALGIFFYLNRRAFGAAGRAQVQNIVAIGAINLLIGFSMPGVIDNFGHLGGLAAGLIAGWALAPRFALDTTVYYSPRVVRRFPVWGWPAALALGLALVAVAALLPGA